MEAAATTRPLTRRRSAVIVLIVMAVGQILAGWEPIWLSPPHFATTDYMYMLPALLWIRVLMYFGFRHPVGWRWIRVLLMLVGFVPILFALGLGFRAALLSTIEPTCVEQSLADGQTLYTCRISLLADSAIDFTFEGSKGALFVRHIETSTCHDAGCKPLKP